MIVLRRRTSYLTPDNSIASLGEAMIFNDEVLALRYVNRNLPKEERNNFYPVSLEIAQEQDFVELFAAVQGTNDA